MFAITKLRAAALLCGLLLTGICSATGANAASTAAPTYTDGTEYVSLPAPYQRDSKSGKVEVVEVFSYACIHCAEFSPYAEKLRKSLPPGVEFKLVPAPFNDTWVPFAVAYHAAEKLGIAESTHMALFKAKFIDNYPIASLDELADFYASHGANRAEFLRIAHSPEVADEVKHDLSLIQAWGVDGTPTIVVDGKYRSANVQTFSQLVDLTQWLVQRELAADKSGK